MFTHAYAHENTCACVTPSTRWSTDTKTHNLCTNMLTHTHTHLYKRIDAQIHTHMHIYTYIMSAHIHTYTYIHTRIQNVHMNARNASLKRRRGSDCAGRPTWHQEALPFSLPASRQRAVQTTSAYLHWCGANPPSSLSTPVSSFSMAPRNEVIFLPFWRVCRMSRIYIYDSENVRSWVMKWGAQQRLGVVASRWLGSGKAKVQGRGMGWGAIAFHLHHVLFRICLCISAFCLDEKGCWRTSFLCTHVHEFLYILHLLHLFILLSYLIFDFVGLTLSLPTHIELPNTHAHTYRDTHTHAHTKTKNTKNTRKKDVTTFSKPQSLTWVRIKYCTFRIPSKITTLFLYE